MRGGRPVYCHPLGPPPPWLVMPSSSANAWGLAPQGRPASLPAMMIRCTAAGFMQAPSPTGTTGGTARIKLFSDPDGYQRQWRDDPNLSAPCLFFPSVIEWGGCGCGRRGCRTVACVHGSLRCPRAAAQMLGMSPALSGRAPRHPRHGGFRASTSGLAPSSQRTSVLSSALQGSPQDPLGPSIQSSARWHGRTIGSLRARPGSVSVRQKPRRGSPPAAQFPRPLPGPSPSSPVSTIFRRHRSGRIERIATSTSVRPPPAPPDSRRSFACLDVAIARGSHGASADETTPGDAIGEKRLTSSALPRGGLHPRLTATPSTPHHRRRRRLPCRRV
ncbi:hypothetical protein Purlil1_155 [Purpureocillium lilacinum]|uniref:Uncharacterized protein n=1 Tax=Purpureocillium lilacinum TaxID=33203 RepID=A0ABR0CGB7_PURLI|nr:hypothetical protein Purlil1_155 [Purpureocillium lilacinum]